MRTDSRYPRYAHDLYMENYRTREPPEYYQGWTEEARLAREDRDTREQWEAHWRELRDHD